MIEKKKIKYWKFFMILAKEDLVYKETNQVDISNTKRKYLNEEKETW